MSRRNRENFWPTSVLKRRGWNNELMKQLLPKPLFFMQNGRPVRVWDREDVLLAESGPRFVNRRKKGVDVGDTARPVPQSVKRAQAALNRAWGTVEPDGSLRIPELEEVC